MSIYTSEIRADLVNINSAISETKKPIDSGDASLKTIRLVAGFLLCKVKLSTPQSLAGSLVVNLLINDVLRIKQLIQKEQMCDENIMTTISLEGDWYSTMEYGETESDRADAAKLNTIALDSRSYLTNAESKISKELRLRVMSIASLCLLIGGIATVSQPLMVAGVVSYFVAHFFIHQTTKPKFFENSAELEKKLHDNITEMTTIIDRMNPQAV